MKLCDIIHFLSIHYCIYRLYKYDAFYNNLALKSILLNVLLPFIKYHLREVQTD